MVAPEADLHRDPAGDTNNQHHPPPPHSPQVHHSLGGASLHLALQSPPSPPPGKEKEDGISVEEDQEKGNHNTDPAADALEKPRRPLSRYYTAIFHLACFLFFTG